MLSKNEKYLSESNILVYPNPLVTVSVTVEARKGVVQGTRKIVKAGTVLPSNDANAKGILLHDIDVTDGDNIGALVVEGYVYEDKLVEPLNAAVNLPEVKVMNINGDIVKNKPSA